MSTIVFSVVAVALLFALSGILRTRVGCGGNCAGCEKNSCHAPNQSENHV